MSNNIRFIIEEDEDEDDDENTEPSININEISNIIEIPITPPPLTGNEKRIASCKAIGGEKKKIGHIREKEFTKQYNLSELNAPIEYKATSDTLIDVNHTIYEVLKEELKVSGANVSNKSGNNIQFTLGQIPELKDIEIEQLTPLLVYEIFNKYLKKNTSEKPADILVYKDEKNSRWIFFNMDDIIEYITTKCSWRKLSSGRIKGDFKNNSKKGFSQYITYEYRQHKGYFLGLNGGAGKKFIDLLMSETYGIKYHCDPFNY
jgi:hypothetical protein